MAAMQGWAWLFAYVVAFVLFQLVVYRYLRDRDGSPVSETTPPGRVPRGATDDVDGPFADPPADDPPTPEGLVRCPHCGGRNQAEPTFTYCRNCLRPLGT